MVRAELHERMKQLKQVPILDRIAGMKEQLLAAGDEAQELRRLPDWAANAIADAGLYRFTLPTELAGEDLTPTQQIEVLEAVCAIDGSVGWCVQINSEINSLVLRTLDQDVAEEVYGDWGVIICCAAAPDNQSYYRPRKVDGGWLVSHRATFGSGSHNATWTWVTPFNDPTRAQPTGYDPMSFLVPRGEFEVVDTWNVAGMRGSGSHDIRTTDVFVPDRLASAYPARKPLRYANPTYRNPTQVEYNKSGVALGVARGAVDAFVELSRTKQPWQTGTLLREVPEAQYRLGEAEATLQSARAFLMLSQQQLSDDLGPLPPEGNALPSVETLRRARLSCTHAAQTARRVVDLIHNTSGTSGSRMDNPLERKLRDAHQAAAHGLITYRHYRNVGMTYMGVEHPGVLRGARDWTPPEARA